MLNFRIFVPLNETLVATVYETRAPTFRKYATEQCMLMPNLSRINKIFWSHFSVFALEKQPENLDFLSFFFYLQKNLEVLFSIKDVHKFPKNIRMYKNVKFIKDISLSLVALLHFCFRKKAFKMLNFQTFFSLNERLMAIFSGKFGFISRKCVFEQGMIIPNLSEKLQFFWSHSLYCALEKQPENLYFHSFGPQFQ